MTHTQRTADTQQLPGATGSLGATIGAWPLGLGHRDGEEGMRHCQCEHESHIEAPCTGEATVAKKTAYGVFLICEDCAKLGHMPGTVTGFPKVPQKRGKGVGTLVREIRSRVARCGVFDTTFMPGGRLKPEQETWLKDRFNLFWDTWVEPQLAELAAKSERKPSTKKRETQ